MKTGLQLLLMAADNFGKLSNIAKKAGIKKARLYKYIETEKGLTEADWNKLKKTYPDECNQRDVKVYFGKDKQEIEKGVEG